ncbi:uncharacterized protein LOC107037477 [Diachasma alloeum]|uniref:uncharacterized protein LOC107037477 n=1 Tax=Diachasma alloeum TaxID=454923 RepID=UPI0007381F4A|nr:uncharacterized protein LOC107037477 [Diachasma alloeum]
MGPLEQYHKFVEIVKGAIETNTPKRKYQNTDSNKTNKINKNNRDNPCKWWDDECSKAKRLRRAAQRKWEYSHSVEDRIKYNREVARTKKLFKKKKRDHFREFAKSIDSRTSAKYVWNICKILKNKWVKVNHNSCTEHLQWLNKIDLAVNKISPDFVPTNPDHFLACQDNEFLSSEFNFVEFNYALSSRKTHCSPGIYGIDYLILKKLPIKYHLILLDIFNRLFAAEQYPEEWIHHFIHFIPKTGGSDVRPIALAPCIAKLFESMIKNRLDWWIEHHEMINNSQTGFRKGVSCHNNLANLCFIINEALAHQQHALAAFLDVKGAFDNVNPQILLDKLAELGCSQKVAKFIQFLTYKRFIQTVNQEDQPRLVYKGVPQGGVLSPLLYSLYVSEITRDLPDKVFVSQFADDVAVYTSDPELDECQTTLVDAIKDINLTESKSALVSLPDSLESGLTGDLVLTLILNVFVKDASNRSTYFVRSVLDYGLFIYYPKKVKSRNALERIQFEAIRAVMGYRKTTPTNVLLAESKLTYIVERAKFLCRNFLIKTSLNTSLQFNDTMNNFSLTGRRSRAIKYQRLIHQEITETLPLQLTLYTYDKFNIYRLNYSDIMTNIEVDLATGRNRRDNEDKLTIKDIINKESDDTYCIYTDGSKVAGNDYTGAAYYCPKLGIEIIRSLNPQCSVYPAECLAIHAAVDLALEHPDKNDYILSDSMSALLALKYPKMSIRENDHILQVRVKHSRFRRRNDNNRFIKFVWVPSHSGYEGNEYVDDLAKRGTSADTMDISKVPFTDYTELFKRKMGQNTVEHCESCYISDRKEERRSILPAVFHQ